MSRIALVGLVVACKGQPDDCAIVRDKPGSAMVELTKRHPNDAVKAAQTIENCVAPTGDECDRIAKVIAAIPGMAPQIAKPGFDAAKTCRDVPPEFRRCLLPSYVLAHADECQAVLTAPITQIEIKPSTGPAQRTDECGFVAIYLDGDGTWLATGRDAKSRCYAPNKAGTPDSDWLETQLRRAQANPCGPSASELAGADDVPYQQVITAMDVSVKAGFVDTGLSSPTALSVPLAAADPKGAASECPATLLPPKPVTAPVRTAPRASGTDALKAAPALIVTKTELTLTVKDTRTVIATLADATAATTLASLTKALPSSTDGLLILQADESTPTKIIYLVVETAKAAGYDNVLFAVKNR